MVANIRQSSSPVQAATKDNDLDRYPKWVEERPRTIQLCTGAVSNGVGAREPVLG
jgi:hypothetical protein